MSTSDVPSCHPIQVAELLDEHQRLAEARANAAMEELLAEEEATAAAQQQQQQAAASKRSKKKKRAASTGSRAADASDAAPPVTDAANAANAANAASAAAPVQQAEAGLRASLEDGAGLSAVERALDAAPREVRESCLGAESLTPTLTPTPTPTPTPTRCARVGSAPRRWCGATRSSRSSVRRSGSQSARRRRGRPG